MGVLAPIRPPLRDRKFADSPLEGNGFELLVRGHGQPGLSPSMPWVAWDETRLNAGKGSHLTRGAWGLLPNFVGLPWGIYISRLCSRKKRPVSVHSRRPISLTVGHRFSGLYRRNILDRTISLK